MSTELISRSGHLKVEKVGERDEVVMLSVPQDLTDLRLPKLTHYPCYSSQPTLHQTQPVGIIRIILTRCIPMHSDRILTGKVFITSRFGFKLHICISFMASPLGLTQLCSPRHGDSGATTAVDQRHNITQCAEGSERDSANTDKAFLPLPRPGNSEQIQL